MDRREALKHVAAILGGAISAPVILGVLGGCDTGSVPGKWQPKTLNSEQDELVATISELIIPQTDTPGAKAARVNEFIDLMLTDWFPDDDRTAFLDGLNDAEAFCKQRFGKHFRECSESEQNRILTDLEEASFREEAKSPRADFFRSMKELTLLGYYTSEIGATQELHLNPMGTFNGCIPFSETGRAYSE